MTNFSQQEQPESVHQTAPVPSKDASVREVYVAPTPYRCIRPQCPPDCSMCNHAVDGADEARVLVADLLNVCAVDGFDAPLEDGESVLVDRARKFLRTRNAPHHTRESLRERCDMFVRCLPQAPMRDMLARLFEDLLAAPHHRSADGAPGSNKPDSESDSSFAAQGMAQDAAVLLRGDAFFPDVRQALGEMLTDGLLDMAESPDWNDSREVDRVIDIVQGVLARQVEKARDGERLALAALRAVPHQPTGERE